jgi:centrosomal protein CEP290
VLCLQIEFLEVRLAEVMAYADIPVNMRPALTELSSNSIQPGMGGAAAGGGAFAYSQQLMALHGGQGGREGAGDGSGGVAGGIKATQVELVRGALLGCLKMLRQMSEALGESCFDCALLPT